MLSNGAVLLVVLLLVFLILGRREFINHQKNLKMIPLRIMVNGTRGKSSVTRLIGAGLKAGKYSVMAKTTGTKPSMIFDNLLEIPVVRLGKANIKEQISITRKAVKEGMNAVVFENMSLRPDLQWIEENKLVQPGIVVITNVRADHLDVMGPTLSDITRNFVNALPAGSTVITAEQEYYPQMKMLCARKNVRIIQSHEEDVTQEEINRFSYFEHRENVALAIEVCKYLGIARDRALAEIYKSLPDSGVLRRYDLRLKGKTAILYNALAANDPDSTFLIFERMEKSRPHTYVLVNCRSDRIDRSLQMAELVCTKMPAELYFATGGNTLPFVKKMIAGGVPRGKIIDAGDKKIEDVYEEISSRVLDNSQIFAIGNIVGYGQSLIDHFVQKVDR